MECLNTVIPIICTFICWRFYFVTGSPWMPPKNQTGTQKDHQNAEPKIAVSPPHMSIIERGEGMFDPLPHSEDNKGTTDQTDHQPTEHGKKILRAQYIIAGTGIALAAISLMSNVAMYCVTNRAASAAKKGAEAAQTQAGLLRTQMEVQVRPRITVESVRPHPEAIPFAISRAPGLAPALAPDLRKVDISGTNAGGVAYDVGGEVFWHDMDVENLAASLSQLVPSPESYSWISVEKTTVKAGDQVTGYVYMPYSVWSKIEAHGSGGVAIYGWLEHCNLLDERNRDPFCWMALLMPGVSNAILIPCPLIPQALFSQTVGGKCR